MTSQSVATDASASDHTNVSTHYTATYSPEDDKLRLYSVSRLDDTTFARVKDAGFRWAPAQELFFAHWSPSRENLMLDLAGDIEDEDKSLVDRAAERADRFADYSENRTRDAERAREAVDQIAGGIPLGQPILVGHHSESRARKDAQRIESGMRKAVHLWRLADYWKRRAAGALGNAKYKERADVRARRIKSLETDRRRYQNSKTNATQFFSFWTKIKEKEADQQHKLALFIANRDHLSQSFPLADFPRQPPASQYEGAMSLWSALTDGVIDAPKAAEIALKAHTATIATCERWIEHLDNRLAYERAMLDESGGLATDRFDIEPGGRVLIGRQREWLPVIRINKVNGAINSVTTAAPRNVTWKTTWKYGIETITDYQAPSPDDAATLKAATKLPPLCNYPGEGFRAITKAEWEVIHKDYRGTNTIEPTETAGRHRRRSAMFDSRYRPVYLTDAKRVDPPPPATTDGTPPSFARKFDLPPTKQVATPTAAVAATPSPFEQMEQALRQGVTVVSAPQLFCTPDELADEVVQLASMPIVGPDHSPTALRLLEPSAGTGRLLAALQRANAAHSAVAVELNFALADQLRLRFPQIDVRTADFLACGAELGTFDRVIMNPPFADAADIKHIEHALGFLKPGGKLVAICADGPRQRATLKPQASHWIDLPAATFKESGTDVNTALLVIDRPI